MFGTEKLCLKWNNFEENTHSAFGELRQDKDFVDVTLAYEDGSQVEAHKVILAASSPFFDNLLKKIKHPHPLIYMRGMRSDDLLPILDFLYNGEAKVFQENLDDFLAIAEDLKLRGLAGTGETKEEMPKLNITEERKQEKLQQNEPPAEFEAWKNLEEREERLVETSFALIPNSKTVGSELQQLDDQIKSLIDPSETMVKIGDAMTKGHICKVCGKEGYISDIKRHIEARHIAGIVHSCDVCGKSSRSRNGLTQQRRREHLG